MISTSDGSLPEEQAKAFAKQYAKEIQAEKDEQIRKIVAAKSYKEGDESLFRAPAGLQSDLTHS